MEEDSREEEFNQRIRRSLCDWFGPFEEFHERVARNQQTSRHGLIRSKMKPRPTVSLQVPPPESPSHIPVHVALQSMKNLVEEPLSALPTAFDDLKTMKSATNVKNSESKKRKLEEDSENQVDVKRKKETNMRNSTTPDSGVHSTESDQPEEPSAEEVATMLHIMKTLDEPTLSPIPETFLASLRAVETKQQLQKATSYSSDSPMSSASTSREPTPDPVCLGTMRLKGLKPARVQKLLDLARAGGKLIENGDLGKKPIEKPVEKPRTREKSIEKPLDRSKERSREKSIEKPVERSKDRPLEKSRDKERPVEKAVEKSSRDKPRDKVEKPLERHERPKDNERPKENGRPKDNDRPKDHERPKDRPVEKSRDKDRREKSIEKERIPLRVERRPERSDKPERSEKKHDDPKPLPALIPPPRPPPTITPFIKDSTPKATTPLGEARNSPIPLQKPPNKTVQSLQNPGGAARNHLSPSGPSPRRQMTPVHSRPGSSLSLNDPPTPQNHVAAEVQVTPSKAQRWACQWDHKKLKTIQRVPLPDPTINKQSKSDFYHTLAKEWKSKADRSKDKALRPMYYIYSSVYFMVEEQSKLDKERTQNAKARFVSMYKDVYNLIGMVAFQAVRDAEDPIAVHILPRVKILGQIMLAFIQYQMYLIKSEQTLKTMTRLEMPEIAETYEFRPKSRAADFATSSSKLAVPHTAPGDTPKSMPSAGSTPSEPTSIPANPWINSVQTCPNTVTMPQVVFETLQSQLRHAHGLVKASRYWEDSKHLARHVDATFIKDIETVCGKSIGMDMSLDVLSQFMLTAVGSLIAEYEEEQRQPVKPPMEKVRHALEYSVRAGVYFAEKVPKNRRLHNVRLHNPVLRDHNLFHFVINSCLDTPVPPLLPVQFSVVQRLSAFLFVK
uniref:AF-4_C domain-containing protein n=1 Tax=Caenorhabditis tropicalis TaxID=1561998 RepID=A0A1I7UK46_9PELO